MTTKLIETKTTELKLDYDDKIVKKFGESFKGNAKDYKKLVEALESFNIEKVKKCIQKGVDVSKLYYSIV